MGLCWIGGCGSGSRWGDRVQTDSFVAEAGTKTREVTEQAEEITEAVRGADVQPLDRLLESGRGVRVVSQDSEGSALLPGG